LAAALNSRLAPGVRTADFKPTLVFWKWHFKKHQLMKVSRSAYKDFLHLILLACWVGLFILGILMLIPV
jgi:hypothetical protein